MKNVTDNSLGFGRWVIDPDGSIADTYLSPEALEWYTRHGCTPDKAPSEPEEGFKWVDPVPSTPEVPEAVAGDVGGLEEAPKKKGKKKTTKRKPRK